jgi:hypothetical protein
VKFYKGDENLEKSVKQAQSIVGHSMNRAENDFYPTPPQITRDILGKESFYGNVWECACGAGDMSKEIIKHGLTVVSTDLINRGYGEGNIDFLKEHRNVDNIITNPPFNIITDFAYHALECTTKKVALLAKLAFLETAERKPLFETTPLARVYVYSKRIRLDKNEVTGKTSGGMIAFAWFVWEHGYKGEPVLKWI